MGLRKWIAMATYGRLFDEYFMEMRRLMSIVVGDPSWAKLKTIHATAWRHVTRRSPENPGLEIVALRALARAYGVEEEDEFLAYALAVQGREGDSTRLAPFDRPYVSETETAKQLLRQAWSKTSR